MAPGTPGAISFKGLRRYSTEAGETKILGEEAMTARPFLFALLLLAPGAARAAPFDANLPYPTEVALSQEKDGYMSRQNKLILGWTLGILVGSVLIYELCRLAVWSVALELAALFKSQN
jgi:hypothetical protein